MPSFCEKRRGRPARNREKRRGDVTGGERRPLYRSFFPPAEVFAFGGFAAAQVALGKVGLEHAFYFLPQCRVHVRQACGEHFVYGGFCHAVLFAAPRTVSALDAIYFPRITALSSNFPMILYMPLPAGIVLLSRGKEGFP